MYRGEDISDELARASIKSKNCGLQIQSDEFYESLRYVMSGFDVDLQDR